MKRHLLVLACGVTLLGSSACDRESRDADTDILSDTIPDLTPATPVADPVEGWSEGAEIRYSEVRRIDLTGDGREESVSAHAIGPSYDSLDVAITIRSTRGDTLWHESWPSLLYFKYEPIEGMADTTVSRIVRGHVEQLVAADRFTMSGGLPPSLRQGGNANEVMREAARYHLAEQDYRLRFDLLPSDPTPPSAYDRIRAAEVADERVAVVLNELRSHPSFMYYAGGEATYVIAWSDRERSFVRIYSCC